MAVAVEARSIPLAKPLLGQAEVDAVADVLRSGQLAQGNAVAAFEAAFAEYVGCKYAVATSSGTTALHLMLLALGIGPGDEVITTPFTFIATANAIRFAGARVVFADIDPSTLNISPAAVEARITPRTRAVLAVHLYGNPCDMGALGSIAKRHNLMLLEDACQAHGAETGGQRVGSLGPACFSFYPTKNMTCGEGGMLCTSDAILAEQAALLRAHGMRLRYVHEALGFNFRMTDIHAALGLVQLSRLDELNAARRANAAYYDATLAGACRPVIHDASRSAWHQYTLVVDPCRRDRVVAQLRQRGIGVDIYYPVPINQQLIYQDLGMEDVYPVAEMAARSVFSIPVHPGLTRDELAYIAHEVNDVLADV
jgi:perosamine synthetase